jgi:cytochrome oxidase Cu insertion factor (SCO1/SenC/PrrC family)
MTGMGGPSGTGDATTVSQFHHALATQGALIVVFAAVAFVAWNQLRSMQYRRAVQRGETFPPPTPTRDPEPSARRFLRIAFGLAWLFDGLLQLQSGMPSGLPGSVVEPSAASSPGWVRHLVDLGTTVWRDHPAAAAASVVWIQLGIGFLLLVAPRGWWSRGAGAVSAGWGLVVWSFGAAFGGIFAPGLTILFGAPGAVVFYMVAGVLVALPDSVWSGPRMGRLILGSTGALLLVFAVLQAWPGRGFWQGTVGGRPGTLAAMVDQMARTSQPHPLSSLVASFASFDRSHGWGVNLVAVVAMSVVGVVFLGWSGSRRRLLLPALVAFGVLCVADWVLIEDFGFWGGTGTDPNSMLPLLGIAVGGYLGTTRPAPLVDGADRVDGGDRAVRALEAGPAVAPAATPALAPGGEREREPVEAGAPLSATSSVAGPPAERSWWERIDSRYAARVAAAVAGVGIVLVGVAPMAAAAADRTADPSIAEAVNGPPTVVDSPAPGFSLTDQHGNPVALADLRGHTVVLTFLDPVCTTDCPVLAQELRVTDTLLGSAAADVRFVAVVANPIYRSVQDVRAFDRQEGLDAQANWSFLTGSAGALGATWNAYGITVQAAPAGGMVVHADIVFVIDARGRLRRVVNADIGAGTATTQSSFSGVLATQIDQVLHP